MSGYMREGTWSRLCVLVMGYLRLLDVLSWYHWMCPKTGSPDESPSTEIEGYRCW